MSAVFTSIGHLLFLLSLVPVSKPASVGAPGLPALHVSVATHYDLGKSIGTRFKDEIQKAMFSNSYFKEKILPYNLTQDGAITYMNLLSAVENSLPQYLDEIKGMAFGIGLDFSELFLWNIQFELQLLLTKQSTPASSCSDLYIVESPSGPIMGHNEDGSTFDMDTTYLIMAEIISPDREKPPDKFTAFCYPGELCGNAFGFTSKHLVYSVNAVFPDDINTKAIARNFLNRAVASLEYDDVANVLMSMRCASGFSLNIGDLSTNRLSNVEVSPTMAVQTKYKNGTGYHFNLYLHSDVQQRMDPSSVHRLTRVHNLPPPSNMTDIRIILGDTGDRDYPIFRTATPPDTGMTLATGIFDFGKKSFFLYRGNPGIEAPLMTLPLSN